MIAGLLDFMLSTCRTTAHAHREYRRVERAVQLAKLDKSGVMRERLELRRRCERLSVTLPYTAERVEGELTILEHELGRRPTDDEVVDRCRLWLAMGR